MNKILPDILNSGKDQDTAITIPDNYKISKYRVSNKEVFRNDDNYKVFVEVAFKKKELFKSLDKINID